jgi:hypothetical protein
MNTDCDELSCECYIAYLKHHAYVKRHQPNHYGPVLSHEDYHIAEDAFLEAGRNLTQWMLDHPLRDPQADPVGKGYWDEVTRWERMAAM